MTRRVVVIVGMHNSGTSLLARLIGQLGVQLGRDILTRDSFEAKPRYDYMEHARITQLQDELLTALGRHWGSATGALPIEPEAWRSAKLRSFRDQLAAVLRDELGATTGLWGFKDPRTARLLPLWDELFAEAAVEPLFLLCLRASGTVARSFASKAQIPQAWADALWRRHYLEALLATHGRPRLFVPYDRWFTDPEPLLERLAGFLGAAPGVLAAARPGLLASIDPKVSEFGTAAAEPLTELSAQLDQLCRSAADGADVRDAAERLRARSDLDDLQRRVA